MPKKIVWKNPNKQDLTTGNVTFDRANKAIMRFQTIGDTQISFCVRPFNETTMPMGGTVAPGVLQGFDLQAFTGLPGNVRAYVREVAVDEGVQLHEIFHYRGHHKVLHGYLIVRGAKILRAYNPSGRAKSFMVLDGVAPFIADLEDGEDVPYHYGR